MVLDVAAYNRDILSDAGRPPGQRCSTRPSKALDRDPGPDQRRLRQHPRRGRAARPAVRQLLLRHAGLHLPAGQEHRRRSAHLHRLRLAHREPGGRQQRARRRRRSCPPTTTGRTRWRCAGASPSRAIATRARRSGSILRNFERLHDLPLHQRHGVQQVRREPPEQVRPLDRKLQRALPRGHQQLSASRRSRSWMRGSPRASAWAGWT